MKVLVTGGSGFLGKHVVKHFGAADFSRRKGKDILNPTDLREIEEFDLVIHLAAFLDKSPDLAEDVFLTNVEGTINLVNAMKPGAALIFASTKDVYGRFADNYAEVPEDCPTLYTGQSAIEWSKLIAERYIDYYGRQKNLRTCILRMSTICAPASVGNSPNFPTHYAEAINYGERVRFPGSGRPVRDILHVDDFSKCCEMFVDSVIRHGIYNVGGGRANAISLKDLFQKMQDISGYQGVVDEENPLPDPAPFNYVSDNTLVTRELDWEPEKDVDAIIRSLFSKEDGK